MRINSILSAGSRLAGLAGVFLLCSLVNAQTPPLQDSDTKYAQAGAPYAQASTYPQRGWQPFHPVTFIQRFQPFAPVDISEYGNGIKPKHGFFFSYERLLWSISRANTSTIGDVGSEGFYREGTYGYHNFPPNGEAIEVYESNSATTGVLGSKFGWGNRWEMGYVDLDDYGWLVSVIDHVAQNQRYQDFGDTVLFNDPTGFLKGFLESNTNPGFDADLNGNGIFGRDGQGLLNLSPPPIYTDPVNPYPVDLGDQVTFIPRFDVLTFEQHTLLSGVEIMRMYRQPRLHHGGTLEWLYGARYLQLYDQGLIFGTGTLTTSGSGANAVTRSSGVLDDMEINQKTFNNIVGGQVGARLSNQRGRWMTWMEGRFTAAANFQNTKQIGFVASQAGQLDPQQHEVRDQPQSLHTAGFKHWNATTVFSPLAEFRVGTSVQLTQAFAFKVSYTGLYIGNVARSIDRINYSLPNMGILSGHNHEQMFVNGLSMGFEFNR